MAIKTINASESIANIAEALAKAQGSMAPLVRDKVNPFFKSKYAELSDIINVIREPFAKNGLGFVQVPTPATEGYVAITTSLLHASGEWIESTVALPMGKHDAQGYGSAFTYARRYGLQALVGLAAEDDDDGNHASSQAPTAPPSSTQKPKPTKSDEPTPPAVPGDKAKEPELPWVTGIFQGGIMGDKEKKIPHKVFVKTQNGEHELSFFGRPDALKVVEDWSTLVDQSCRFQASITKRGDATYKNLVNIEFPTTAPTA